MQKLLQKKGETSIVTPRDLVPEEVKKESINSTDHPEETTSEQVVNTQVTIDQKINTGGDNSLLENSPTSSTAPAQDNTQTGNNNGDNNNVQSSPNNQGQNTDIIPGTSITEPNDNSAPEPSPSTDTTQPSTPPASSTPQSPDSSPTQSSPDTSSPDPSVQGVRTGQNISWVQKIINFLFNR